MMTISHERLERASAVIAEAMELALRFHKDRTSIATRAKGFQDFVSEADTAVEQLVRDRLAEAFPGETVLGEEMGGVADDAYWIVDPIDGTTNFLRGSPLWGISLGFVRHGRPDLGVVAMPAMGEIYAAADGTGLYLNGQPFVRDTTFEDVRMMSLGDSAAADSEEVAALTIGLRHAGWVVQSIRSTSIGLVFSARGTYDGHLQKFTTMWDIAGGAVLAREAGLDVRIGTRNGIPYIAAATPALMAATEPFWPEIQPMEPLAAAG
jgi:myo-inositol-1(or 4)-monophosphatase